MPEDDDLDVAKTPPTPPRKKKRWLILTMLLAATLITAAGVYFAGIGRHDQASEPNTAEKSVEAVAPALYLALDPPFVVNFEDQGELRFLQVSASIMAYDAKVIEAVTYHMPRIRSAVLLLLGNQTYETIRTMAGKQKLREAMLQDIRQVMAEAAGNPAIEAVYLTGFVMQ
jgi:flagellar FliL protein